MRLWRISRHPGLDGAGGLCASGRWHTRGKRVVYCAPNPSTSLLEILVHLEVDAAELPELQYLEIEAPDNLSIETLGSPDCSVGEAETQQIGNAWLTSRRTALLRVPSALVPMTFNVLLNPEHPEADRVRVVQILRRRIEPRLLSWGQTA
jgi:RES domain-containing protein